MFRLLIVLIAIQVVLAGRRWCEQHPNVCNHRHRDYHKGSHDNDGLFHEISWDLISSYRKAQRVCESDVNIREVYEKEFYKLSLSLSNFTADDITVKARYRVLFVQAYKGGSEDKVVSELRVMPDFVSLKDGFWTFTNNILEVNIPYSVALGTEITKKCESNIDESIISVPKQEIDARFATDTPFAENSVY